MSWLHDWIFEVEDSTDKKLWQAAADGKEAELGRLIDLGGDVNWHKRDWVRRRMCLAWARAPASSSPLSSVAPAAPARHGAIFPTAAARRAPHPRVLAHSSHPVGP